MWSGSRARSLGSARVRAPHRRTGAVLRWRRRAVRSHRAHAWLVATTEWLDFLSRRFVVWLQIIEILSRIIENNQVRRSVRMRAVVLRDGRLDVREVAAPAPGPGEMLLRTLSTAICASDVHFMDHPEMGINDPTGRSLYDANRDIVLGHEFVGEVVGHGPGCTEQFPVGTRVTSIPIRLVNGGVAGARIIGQPPEAQGSFGEFVVIAEALAKSVDDGVSNDAAALTDAF